MENHLVDLYIKWKADPATYSKQMSETIDKIIFTTIRNKSLYKIDLYEDNLDVLQDLRVRCFKALNLIKPPLSNKRIYWYFVAHIKWALKTKKANVAKYLSGEVEATQMRSGDVLRFYSEPAVFNFGDELTNQVAELLSDGHNKGSVCKQLNISRKKLNTIISNIRNTYLEDPYYNIKL